MPTQAILDMICGLLAGRAAEDLFMGEIGAGASDDLEKATKAARSLVIKFGMSERLPNLNFDDSTGQEYGFQKPYSEDTARIIDNEIARIIAEQYQRAKDILTEYAAQHNTLRDMLVKSEVIYTNDVVKVLGPRKWTSRTDEIIELNREEEEKERQQKESEKGRSEPAAEKDTKSRSGSRISLKKEESGKKAEENKEAENSSENDDDPGTPPPAPFEKM